MTQATIKKFEQLSRITDRYTPKDKDSKKEPFAGSAAKYHPALKKLASK
ncbi:hypothetical protein [Granulicella sp. L60]|nr:hypothetical protein [Granulicella sp. L60]